MKNKQPFAYLKSDSLLGLFLIKFVVFIHHHSFVVSSFPGNTKFHYLDLPYFPVFVN